MCTNEIEYATITTFMHPQCERAGLSGYTVAQNERFFSNWLLDHLGCSNKYF